MGGPILVAVLADFLLDLALAPATGPLGVVARGLSFLFGAALAVLFGWWLGARVWPKRGPRLTSRVLRRTLRAKSKPLLVLTERPDVPPSLWKRVLEVVGFSAGISVILAAILALLGAGPNAVRGISALATILALWGAFVLVPYWSYGRMGVRVVDPIRWTILPLSRRYADRLKLSNGALALIGAGLVFNLAFRAGASEDVAFLAALSTVATTVASVLIIATSAVTAYSTREMGLVKALEAEALALGIRDGRGLTDGEFLPRV